MDAQNRICTCGEKIALGSNYTHCANCCFELYGLFGEGIDLRVNKQLSLPQSTIPFYDSKPEADNQGYYSGMNLTHLDNLYPRMDKNYIWEEYPKTVFNKDTILRLLRERLKEYDLQLDICEEDSPESYLFEGCCIAIEELITSLDGNTF